MDTTPLSRASPVNDVIAPRAAAQKAPVHAENPPEKTVKSSEGAVASNADSKQPKSAPPEQQAPQLEGRYIDLPEAKTFAYRIVQTGTDQVVVQIPSEQAVKLRAYLQQKERADAQRREDARNEPQGIYA